MDDIVDRFTAAIAELRDVADSVTTDDAMSGFDETTLQNFWRDWTGISQWAGALWRKLNEDLGEAARPVASGGPDVGGSG